MKTCILGLIAIGLAAQDAVAQEIAFPRFSPLPFEDTAPSATMATAIPLEFGTPLRVIESDAEHVIVLLPDERRARVRRGNLMISSGQAQAVAGPDFAIEGRGRLSFWDSSLRVQGFLRDGPSTQTRPLLVEAGTGGMPAFLPITELAETTTRTGRSVQIAGGLVPMAAETLTLGAAGSSLETQPISLHVIVDGSTYARDFSEGRLQELSKRLGGELGEPGESLRVTKTVLLETGDVVGPNEVPLSGLRRLLPQSAESGAAADGLSNALIGALDSLQVELDTDTAAGRASILLILLGPALRGDIVDDPRFLAVSERLKDTEHLGLLLGSATPEPSDLPDRVRAGLGAGLPGTVVGFGSDLAQEVAAFSQTLQQRDTLADVTQLCAIAQTLAVPCLSGSDPESLRRLLSVPDVEMLDWFSVPLWFVVDGGTLALVEGENLQAPAVAAPPLIDPEVERLTQVVDAMRAESDIARTQLATVEAALLRQQTTHAESLSKLDQDLAEATHSRDAALAELQALLERSAATPTIAPESEAQARDLSRARRDLGAAQAEVQRLSDSVQVLRDRHTAEIEHAEQSITRLTIEAQATRDDLARTRSDLSQREQALAKAQEAADQAEQRTQALQTAVTQERNLRAQIEQERDAAVMEHANTTQRQAETEAELTRAVQQTAALDRTLSDLTAANSALSQRIAEREIALAAAAQTAKTTAEEADNLRRQWTEAKALAEDLAQRLALQDDVVTDLTAQLAQADVVQNELDIRTLELTAALTEATNRLVDTQTMLAAETQRADRTQTEFAAQERVLAQTEMQRTQADAALAAAQASHAAELAELGALHSTQITALQANTDAIARESAQMRAATVGIFVELARELGLENRVAGLERGEEAPLRQMAAAIVNQFAEVRNTTDLGLAQSLAERDAEIVALRVNIDSLMGVNSQLQDQLTLAATIVEENRKLVEIIEASERMAAERDVSHQQELATLRAQVAASRPKADTASARPSAPRPTTRPVATPNPEPTVAALPGSPLQRQPQGVTAQTGVGFFGN